MLTVISLSLLAATVTDTTTTCGKSPSKVPDCQNNDMGACGNACCLTNCSVGPQDPEDVYEALKGFLQDGGIDGSYKYITGPGPGGQNPGDDLRPYNLTQKFIFQGTHTTTGGYVDTINLQVYTSPDGNSGVRAFSISQIHGALGDGGQTYKNLAYLNQQMQAPCELKILHGCGKDKES